jgi:hypothetical protein
MMANLWARLEAAPDFGGPRRHLQGLLGDDLVALLERTGILKAGRESPTFPCTGLKGLGCRRQIVEIDDELHAVCENLPVECPDLLLSARDATKLTVDLVELCHALNLVFELKGAPEPIPDVVGVVKVGYLDSDRVNRQPVYLATRSSGKAYGEAIASLAIRQGGVPLAILMPTARFLTDQVERRAQQVSAKVVVLCDVVAIGPAGFTTTAKREHLLFDDRTLGGAASSGLAEIVARALICDGDGEPRWHDLNENEYKSLRSEASRYNVFADELRRSIIKPDSNTIVEQVRSSHFSTIRTAVTSVGRYDPNISGPDLTSSKQIFQRARAEFDVKLGASAWSIFQSVRHEEGHVVYSFAPRPGVSFAYVFLPDG